MKNIIPFNKPYLCGDEIKNLSRVCEGLHFSGSGPFSEKSERWLSQYFDDSKVLLTSSCTAALEISALLLDISEGDEIIMPSFTFVSTANAFALRGATPVFVDIDPDTLCMDLQGLQRAINNKTKAVVIVHYSGICRT